jgi:hypothetical protein
VFLKVYADDSSDQPDNRILCAGSFLGWPRDFYYAGEEWEGRLSKDNLRYFRACECEMLIGEFDPIKRGLDLSQARAFALSVRYDLLKIIEKSGIGAISASILLDDYKTLIRENEKARNYYGTDQVIMAYKRLIKATCTLMERDFSESPSLKIAFVFDEHQKWREAEEAYEQLKEEEPACAKRMLIAGHSDDKAHAPLQMADLIASEARYKTAAWLDSSPEERPAFKSLSANNNIYFMGVMTRDEMLLGLEDVDYEIRRPDA